MYTGLELAIIGYIIVLVIHIGLFRFFRGFYEYIDSFGTIPPTAWCILWPLGYTGLLLFYVYMLLKLIYYSVKYLITNEWKYKGF